MKRVAGADFSEGVDPARIDHLEATGMLPAFHAERSPGRLAIISSRGGRTYGELNANANRLVDALRKAGLKAGDHIALLCPNTPEFIEVYIANLRSGMRLVPVNWHLGPDEVAYIVDNSDAKALIAHADFAEAAKVAGRSAKLMVRLAIGGAIEGFQSYAEALAASRPENPAEPILGAQMLYTSGTTGRPKGVYRELPEHRRRQWGAGARKGFRDGDVSLLLGPAYHAAPLGHSIHDAILAGVTIVLTEKFEAEATLAAIEKHRVTHSHMVSTMFQRILNLPADVRGRYNLSSLRHIVHGAAPTPPDVKRAMLEWWGPIIDEYYGASETLRGFYITAAEWLRKPGSVGRAAPEIDVRLFNEAGDECKPGEVGMIHFRLNAKSPFEYYKDPEKTRSIYRNGTHFTVGDMGYLDEDGYLFLTGRTAECIISGGVNIYPQEIDNELAQHPAVLETCTIGVPNKEWGEEVRAVVALRPGFEPSPALANQIIAWVTPRLAKFKIPRAVDFVADIPRSEAGKVLRGRVRAPYWAGREKQI